MPSCWFRLGRYVLASERVPTMSYSPSTLHTRLNGTGHQERTSSLPPLHRTPLPAITDATNPGRPSSIPIERMVEGPGNPRSSSDLTMGHVSLDLLSHLKRSGHSLVKSRSGSVLSRGFILKTDFYPSGRALDLDINVHGAPNFRATREGGLNIFGVAQPRTQGLRAILSVLKCRPNIPNPTHVIWFSTREEPLSESSGSCLCYNSSNI
jgi:hypothetical protein